MSVLNISCCLNVYRLDVFQLKAILHSAAGTKRSRVLTPEMDKTCCEQKKRRKTEESSPNIVESVPQSTASFIIHVLLSDGVGHGSSVEVLQCSITAGVLCSELKEAIACLLWVILVV